MKTNHSLKLIATLTPATFAGLAMAQCTPTVPTNIRATDGTVCGFVDVSWSYSSGTVLFYRVYRGLSPSTATDPIGTMPPNATTYRDLTAFASPFYYYRVAAFGPCGGSNYSAANLGYAGGEPATPTGLRASYGSECGGVAVRWTALPNVTYQVWHHNTNDYQSAALVGASNDGYVLDRLAWGSQETYYWVTAQNLCGRSDPAGPVRGYRGEVSRGATASAGETRCDGINVSWGGDNHPGSVLPITWKVWRHTNQYGWLFSEEVHSVSQTSREHQNFSFLDTDAAPGTPYYYWVEAVNPCGDVVQPHSSQGTRLLWPHSFSHHPDDVIVPAGGRAMFSAALSGTAPTWYQWYRGEQPLANGGNINGANTLELTIDPVEPADAGEYRLEVGNSTCYSSSRLSDPADLGVLACYADCDTGTGPGVLDIFDFLCFQNRFAANDPYACDCDTSSGRNVCDIFDLLCFQNAFATGCP